MYVHVHVPTMAQLHWAGADHVHTLLASHVYSNVLNCSIEMGVIVKNG